MARSWCNAAVVASILSLGLVAAAPTPSFAQSNCTCVVPAGSTGLLSSPNGEVYVSGLLDVAATDVALQVGSQVSTGASGSAVISFGDTCSFAMGPSSQVTIEAEGANMCVRLLEDGAGGGGVNGVGAAIVGGAAVVGGGALVVALGNKAPVSAP